MRIISLIITISLLILFQNIGFSYTSDRVKKTVISTNTDKTVTNEEENNNKQPSTNNANPIITPKKKPITKARKTKPSKPGKPLFAKYAVSFTYNDILSAKPHMPYIRMYMDGGSYIDASLASNGTTKYFLIDAQYMAPFKKHKFFSLYHGIGISHYSTPAKNYLISYAIGLEKTIFSNINLGMVFEPLILHFDNDANKNYIRINNTFATKLIWQF